MCYNCGCGHPEDDMGHPDNITTSTFAAAAKAEKQSVDEAMRETLKLLQRELAKKD